MNDVAQHGVVEQDMPEVGDANLIDQDPHATGSSLVPSWLANVTALSWRVIVVVALAAVVAWLLSIFWIVTA